MLTGFQNKRNENFIGPKPKGHAKAHRSKEENLDMSLFERLVTEGKEKADELAKRSDDGWRT